MPRLYLFLILFSLSCSSAPTERFDPIIRNGMIYDGSGSASYRGDVAIHGDRIAAIGDLSRARGDTEVDAEGLAVAPGFINMLSWAVGSLIEDGRSQGDIRQGVTLEVFGEGISYGPVNERVEEALLQSQIDVRFDIEWTTLGEYLDYLVRRGISPNVASFVGATTLRIHEIGFEDRPPTPQEMARMQQLVRQAMEEGALGVGSSLIYAPAFYAQTDELIELCKAASPYGGMYISHMRSEGRRVGRLKDPATRARVRKEMTTPTDEWENFNLAAGPEGTLLVGFKNDELKPLTGKTLAEVAKMRGTSPEDTAMDLVIEDGSRVQAVYFLMSEDNVRKQIALPWVSFGSNAGSMATEGVFLKSSTHPRAYGNFARLLGKYVRDEEIISLEETIRRLTTLPAENLQIKDGGSLQPGYLADVVVFDPEDVQDHATYENPHQYSTGVVHVWVNGTQVLEDGEHTGATPGRVVRGPGWKKKT